MWILGSELRSVQHRGTRSILSLAGWTCSTVQDFCEKPRGFGVFFFFFIMAPTEKTWEFTRAASFSPIISIARSIFTDELNCWDMVIRVLETALQRSPRGIANTSDMSKQVQFNPIIQTTCLDVKTKVITKLSVVNNLNPTVEFAGLLLGSVLHVFLCLMMHWMIFSRRFDCTLFCCFIASTLC